MASLLSQIEKQRETPGTEFGSFNSQIGELELPPNSKSTRGFWWVSLNFPESRDKILNFPHKMFWFGCDCFYWSRGFSELDSEPSEPKPFSLPSPLPRWPQGTKRTFLFWKLQFIYGCKISFIALNFCSNFGKFYKSFFFLQLKFRSY